MKNRHRVDQVVSKAYLLTTYLLTTLWLSITDVYVGTSIAANFAKLPELLCKSLTRRPTRENGGPQRSYLLPSRSSCRMMASMRRF